MSVNWNYAQQGASGLWFKSGVDRDGRRHLLVAESRSGVDGGSHDHYWQNPDGTYGVQLKDRSGTGTVRNHKGHIYPENTTFPGFVNADLSRLFSMY